LQLNESRDENSQPPVYLSVRRKDGGPFRQALYPSVAGLSRLLLHTSGTPCQRRRRHSVNISRHGSSANRIQISSS